MLHEHIYDTRKALGMTQAEMAEHLMMDVRSYVNIDTGKSLGNGLTLMLYLIYCCPDVNAVLTDVRAAFDEAFKKAST